MKNLNQTQAQEFVSSLISAGSQPQWYAKHARVQAYQPEAGHTFKCILKNGTEETPQEYVCDGTDWKVTNPGGEPYKVDNKTFTKKYESAVDMGDGWYKPKGGPQLFVQFEGDDLEIDQPSWGEGATQVVLSGGFLNVTYLQGGEDPVYGVGADEFAETYKRCNEDGSFID